MLINFNTKYIFKYNMYMSSTSILLIILIPFAFIFAIICLFLAIKNIKKQKRKDTLLEIKRKWRVERLKNADSIISRINSVVNKAPKYFEIFKSLQLNYDEIENQINRISVEYDSLSGDWIKLRKKEFNSVVYKILNMIDDLDFLEEDFKKISDKILQQQDFLQSEHIFYSQQLREAISVYKNKRILLGKISNQIEKLSLKISNKSSEFKVQLDSADNHNASIILKEYSELVFQFVNIISKSSNIETYLYVTIPSNVKMLDNLYETKKKELKAPLGHINFKNTLLDLGKMFQKAKEEYLGLDVDSAEKTIKSILKTLSAIQKLINFEIISRNFFVKYSNDILKILKTIFKKYAGLKNFVKEIVEKGKILGIDLEELLMTIKHDYEELDKLGIHFQETIKKVDIPFSSKVARMKRIINKLIIFIDNINEALKLIWATNVESSQYTNKYRKSEAAINEILSNLRKENLRLSTEEEEAYEDISNSLSNISSSIENNQVSREIKEEVKQLMQKTSSFYEVVGGNLQIAEMARNLIKDLSPQRALNARLNAALNNSEKCYLEGNYGQSLNIIITELESGGK